MKLVILCGSLEPGKDGVGDYSRRLARHCRENGHSVIVVSLNDQWISANHVDDNEIRLTRNNSWPSRMNVLQCRLEAFRPDWISVQFVPYAYHHRGFCSELVFHLSSIHIQVQWELMFHELWLGLNSTDSLKFRLTGWVQKRAALRLHRALRPSVTHTQSTAYVSFLKRENIYAIQLPLFSNIEIVPDPDFAVFQKLLSQNGMELQLLSNPKPLILTFFGSLHPEWNPEMLMKKLTGKNVIFLSLGRLGKTGEMIWESFSAKYKTDASFIRLGELSSRDLSVALQFSDAGVAASPWNLIEKSGSVAAMIEHGLPVIVTRNDFLAGEELTLNPRWSSLLHAVWLDTFDVNHLVKTKPHAAITEIGSQFLADLANK